MAITKLNASVDLLNDVDTTTAAPADKEVLAWDSNTSQWVPSEGNFVEEAPTSGLVYGRANGTWVEVTGGGGGGTGGAGSVNLAYDKLTPDGTADTFDLTLGGDAREPLGATNLLVSVNGVIQEPGVAFTTAGSTITFTEVPQTDDVIDFIVELTNGSHWELNGVNLEYAGEGTKVIVDQFQANGDAVFNGNVGVGTDDPEAPLSVAKNTTVGTASNASAVFQANTASGVDAKLVLGVRSGGRPYVHAVDGDTKAADSLDFGVGANPSAMRIDESGNVGIGQPSPDAKFHVKETINSTGDVRLARFETFTTGDNAYLDLHVNNKTNSVDFRSSGTSSGGFSFGDGISDPHLLINAQGNVGIGVNPTTGTFDLSAKEQLAEWKTKAKKNSWPVVTDGAFEQEPTEDLVSQWIETRAAGDRLQVRGNISATGKVIADTPSEFGRPDGLWNISGWYGVGELGGLYTAGSFGLSLVSNGYRNLDGKWTSLNANGKAGAAEIRLSPEGDIFFYQDAEKADGSNHPISQSVKFSANGDASFVGSVTASAFKGTNFFRPGDGTQDTGGFKFTTANSVRPIDGTGTLSNGVFNLGDAGYRFKDAHFSGTVNAKSSTISNAGTTRIELNDTTNATGKKFLRSTNGRFDVVSHDYSRAIFVVEDSGDTTIRGDLTSEGDAQFSGSVTAGTMRVRNNRVYDSGADGIGLYFTKSGNAILPTDNDGQLVDDGPDLGNTQRRFKDAYLSGRVMGMRIIQDGAPVIDAKGLITTLSTLRKATMDETKDIRESLRSAIDELVAGFEQEIAAMPAPEPEVSTMPAEDES